MDNMIKIQDRKLWDCESSLYDSFELKAFKAQLDSALNNSRCLSMPRYLDPYPGPKKKKKKQSSRVLRPFLRLVRSVFRLKSCSSNIDCEIYGGYLSSDGLTTIPEGCEKGSESPEFDRTVRKTFSERYTSSTGSSTGGLNALAS